MPGAAQFVRRSDLEQLLAQLQRLPGDPAFGFFGPGSVTWRVNRESAVFLAAGRAALLQLAHPWVATALAQHSNLVNDAIGRFHSTFRVIYTMLFGTRAQALAASRQLYGRHTAIQGEMGAALGTHPAHEPYRANEAAALRWVYATLVDSACLAYDLVLPSLSLAERELYYGESKRMAMLFGIAPADLPPDWSSFQAYMQGMLTSSELAVDAGGRTLGVSVMAGVGTWVRPPRWYRALTASWLSPQLAQAFALPLEAAEQRSLRRARRWLPRLYPRVPKPFRFVGPYREADARLHHRALGAWTERSNRFWMGQPRLLYADPKGLADR